MASNSIMQLMNMMQRSGSPQQFLINLLEQQKGNNPILVNLLQLAKKNDTKSIEQIARNICNEKGVDFDTEFNNFKKQFGL